MIRILRKQIIHRTPLGKLVPLGYIPPVFSILTHIGRNRTKKADGWTLEARGLLGNLPSRRAFEDNWHLTFPQALCKSKDFWFGMVESSWASRDGVLLKWIGDSCNSRILKMHPHLTLAWEYFSYSVGWQVCIPHHSPQFSFLSLGVMVKVLLSQTLRPCQVNYVETEGHALRTETWHIFVCLECSSTLLNNLV